MYWPKFSMRKFAKKLKSTKKRSGVSCTYLRWSKQTGLKLYMTKQERDRCAKAQAFAEGYKLAPKAGPSVEIELIQCLVRDDLWDKSPEFSTRKIYGYFTQHAPGVTGRTPWRRIELLEEQLSRIGIDNHDLCPNNVGLVGKRLVCIDFDSASCSIRRMRRKQPA